jgi:DNA-binding MarR family transcriptional regulator
MTVLRVLDPGDAGMRLADLARDADVTRQAIQQIVADLERLGIVESLPDARDGRARRVRYTPYGRAGYERCMAEFDALERELAERLGPRRLRDLKAALEALA